VRGATAPICAGGALLDAIRNATIKRYNEISLPIAKRETFDPCADELAKVSSFAVAHALAQNSFEALPGRERAWR
jgi:hypothetical protein